METALQEIFEYWNTQNNPLVILNWIASNEKRLLEKEKEQIKPLIDALEDIKNWDDDLEVEWGDCGERAIAALKLFNQTK